MAVILLGIALSVLDGTIVNLALPGIAHDLQVHPSESIWVVNAYQIATLALLLPCAALGDVAGYRRVYLGGLALFTAASLGCVAARSLPSLAAFRALQGLGAAGIMGVSSALVRLTYPRRLLGRGMALNSLVVAVASVAGPSFAAAVLSVASWPWLFALNLPLGIALLLVGPRALPVNVAPAPAGVRLSWLDVLLNSLMFGLVFLGADALGARNGDAASTTSFATGAALLAAGVAVGVVYVRRQLALPLPMLPLDLLRIPVFRLSMTASVSAFAAQMLAYIALPFLLLDSHGRSLVQAGLLITAWPLAIVVTAPLAGRLIGRVADGLLGGVGMGLFSVGLMLLALLPAQPVGADIVWRMALCGAGFGFFQSPNNHTIVTSAPPHRAGGASGMLGTARLVGQTTGAVALAIVLSVAGAPAVRGLKAALALAACLAATAAVASMLRLRHAPARP